MPAPSIWQEKVEALPCDVLGRVQRGLCRRLPDNAEPLDALAEREPALAALLRPSLLGHLIAAPQAGRPQRLEFGKRPPKFRPHGGTSADADGCSLHGSTQVGKIDRKGLEKLCRYLVRPPLSAQRLELAGGGQVRVHLKNEWSGGVKSVLMPESDLVLRLRASVPLPRRC